MSPHLDRHHRSPEFMPGPAGSHRLLGLPPATARTDHLARWGALPRRSAGALAGLADAAGLNGRGGASFPTGRKVRSVAEHAGRGRVPIVVANCCEGDPTSAKDRVLISRSPHLVIDGAVAAAVAVGADRIILAVHHRSSLQAHLRTAIAERGADGIALELAEVPARFIASEASSLVNYLSTGDARPLGRMAPIWERGVQGRPTFVGNAETLAHLALITRFGADWFRSVGTATDPGTTLVTIGGAVPQPGVLEIAHGTPIRSILASAGQPPSGWALFGGLAGRWVDLGRIGEIGYTTTGLTGAGATRGVGSITVLPPDGCVLAETTRILDGLAHAGAGQCGPCMFGLPAIASDMAALEAGDQGALTRLRRRLPVIDGRGGCGHPDGAVALAASALSVLCGPLAGHLHDHLVGRGCPAGTPVVPVRSHRERVGSAR